MSKDRIIKQAIEKGTEALNGYLDGPKSPVRAEEKKSGWLAKRLGDLFNSGDRSPTARLRVHQSRALEVIREFNLASKLGEVRNEQDLDAVGIQFLKSYAAEEGNVGHLVSIFWARCRFYVADNMDVMTEADHPNAEPAQVAGPRRSSVPTLEPVAA